MGACDFHNRRDRLHRQRLAVAADHEPRDCRVRPSLQGCQQLQLARQQHRQRGVFDAEVDTAIDALTGPAHCFLPTAGEHAADSATDNSARTKRHAGDGEIGGQAERGADGSSLPQTLGGQLQDLRVKEIVVQAAAQRRRSQCLEIVAVETIERQQSVGANLFALADHRLQIGDLANERSLVVPSNHHPIGSDIDQQLTDRAQAGVPARRRLALERGGKFGQARAVTAEQGRELRVQGTFAASKRCDDIKSDLYVQAAVGEYVLPLRETTGGMANKVEHRHHRPRTRRQHVEFGAELGVRRLGGVDDVKDGINVVEQQAQDFRLLLEAAVRFRACKEGGERGAPGFTAGKLLQVRLQGD